MSHRHFLRIFFSEHIIVIVGILFLIGRYIKKGFFIVDVGTPEVDWKLIKTIQTHRKLLTVILNLAVFALIFFYIFVICIPFFKDLPYVYRGEYSYIEGVVIKDPNIDSSNKIELYNVTIKDAKTGEKLRVDLYGKNGIWTGDEIKAEYFPNSEVGILLEKNGEQVRGKKADGGQAEGKEEDENGSSLLARVLILLISGALYGAFMKLAFKVRYGRTTVKDGTLEGAVVRVNRMYCKFLLIFNIIYIPLGILAFLATLIFIVVKDKENVRYTIFIFACSVVAFVLWRYLKNKRIRITESGIWVKTLWKKEKFYFSTEIRYMIPSENKIRLLLGPSRRKIAITRLYDNFEVLLAWLEMNCKKRRKRKIVVKRTVE